VLDGSRAGYLGDQRLLVESVFEDGLDAFVGRRLDFEGTPAGGLEAVGAIGFAQALDAHAGAEALLGMGARGDNALGDFGGGFAGFADPPDNAARRPFGMGAVVFGHMLFVRGMAVFVLGTQVAGHAQPVVEYLDGRSRQAHLDLLLNEPVGHAVVMVVGTDVEDPGAKRSFA